jgi:chromate reductase, NAD(P)H dehydrogenase (quinone)
MADRPKILAFAGSARRESLNRKLLGGVVAFAREAGAEVTVLDLNEWPLPLYHGDLEEEQGLPPKASELIGLLMQHHGLLIASPEYNSMMSPLLKNTIDWCTRGDEDPFTGRVAAVVAASPGAFGGIRGMTLVRQLLTHLGAHVIPEQCLLPQAHKAFDDQGNLTIDRSRQAAQRVAQQLVETARRLHLASPGEAGTKAGAG